MTSPDAHLAMTGLRSARCFAWDIAFIGRAVAIGARLGAARVFNRFQE